MQPGSIHRRLFLRTAWIGAALALSSLSTLPAYAAAPIVSSFTASPTNVLPGGTVALVVEAQDPDCAGTCTTGCGQTVRADLTAWSASGGSFDSTDNGTTASPYTASAVWRAPATEASYTIQVSISDSGTFLCGGRQTTTAELTVNVTTVVGQPPVVDQLTAQPAQLLTDQTSRLECVASDPDGDPLLFSWSSTLGTVTETSPGNADFSSPEPGLATVTCTVDDGTGLVGSDSIVVSITGARPEKSLREGLVTPQHLAVDSLGDVFVADHRAGGITVLHLGSGELAYHLRLPDAECVAVDWNDDLLIGGRTGARVIDRHGNPVRSLRPDGTPGAVVDVATDLPRLRYGVLYGDSGRVVLFDAGGAVIGSFGALGDGPADLLSPTGLAFTPGGDLVVADGDHGLIKVFNPSGTLLASFGGLGGGAGEFIRLADVAVDDQGLIYAVDSYQDWVQVFDAGGNLREVLGTYGDELGQTKTPAGVTIVDRFDRMLVASINSSSVQVFVTSPVAPTSLPLPRIQVSPTQLSFPPQPVGTTGVRRTVTVTNPGGAPLGLGRRQVGRDFALLDGCGDVLDPGASCSLRVAFSPTAVGTRSGRLTLEHSAGPETVVVALSGTGILPGQLALSRPSVSFPDQKVGTTSAPQTVELINVGTQPVAVGAIRTAGDFGQINDCPATLPGGARCTIEVRFTPSRLGDELTGSLTVSGGGSAARTALQGASVGRVVASNPASLFFGSVPRRVPSPPLEVRLENTGTEFLSLGPLTLEGAAAGEFFVADDRCSLTRLAVGESCSFLVSFVPRSSGAASARVRVPGDALNSPLTVELLGNGEGLAEIPTLDQVGLFLLAGLLAGLALLSLRRREAS